MSVALIGHVFDVGIGVVSSHDRRNDLALDHRRIERTETHQRTTRCGSLVEAHGVPCARGADLDGTGDGFTPLVVGLDDETPSDAVDERSFVHVRRQFHQPVEAAELQHLRGKDRDEHGHVGAFGQELRVRCGPMVPIDDEQIVVDEAGVDLVDALRVRYAPDPLRKPVGTRMFNDGRVVVDAAQRRIKAGAAFERARNRARRGPYEAEMFSEQCRSFRTGRFVRLRSALKLVATDFGDDATLAVRCRFEFVDEQRGLFGRGKDVGCQELFERSASPTDERCVVDGVGIVFVGRRTGDMEVAQRMLGAVLASLRHRERVVGRRDNVGDAVLANDLAAKRAHSNHGVSKGAVGRPSSMPGTPKREGFRADKDMSYGHDMDFDVDDFEHPMRDTVRAWIEANPNPTGRQLAEAGYVAPHWPAPYGLGSDPLEQMVIDQELQAAGIRRPSNAIGIGWSGPTILHAGTDEQKDRYLLPMLAGEEIWCQMFSEPEAGSDLAALATRAVRDGDEYVINGSKIWTSGGHQSQFGILLARTDPDVSKHRGISYFICPTDLPGLTMSPIVDMTTAHSFNECFFDDVRIPASLRVGEEGDGWRLAKVTLSNERVQLSASGSLWGAGPSASNLLDLVREAGGTADPVQRQQLAGLHAAAEVLRLNRLRTLSSRLAGRTPGPEASIQKIMADEHGQHVMEIAKSLAGAAGMLEGSGPAGELPPHAQTGATEINTATEFDGTDSSWVDPVWHYGYLFSPALTLGGGTFAVQRNIVAEKVLGLPRGPDVEQGLSWSESRRAG